uniref:Uncharacterized protein n=1 Tax=Physcomitrium patens TaxID=3218 RepID=A0A2K1JDS3_PHYPA|nr:hypothetical protein PHYPA_019954 [Physcomitrium patens]
MYPFSHIRPLPVGGRRFWFTQRIRGNAARGSPHRSHAPTLKRSQNFREAQRQVHLHQQLQRVEHPQDNVDAAGALMCVLADDNFQ